MTAEFYGAATGKLHMNSEDAEATIRDSVGCDDRQPRKRIERLLETRNPDV
jgi:hypothetical protein